ncbi:hypothetical protein IQ217_18485 [Synechocystis salina LEGE 00031]|uniref:Uncharacterized protein n=1 Tax=Synechocystis salina LEGE 00031 TaxID=1828736 RepID=A0ABR9VWN1_9SYNC|nr:hypothetical protein [Synechocystis salina]MBE9255775.1 hypothetical protein [Synechocystis salina LEGE 00031]
MHYEDVLLEMAKMELAEARHYDGQRERMVGFSVLVTGGTVAALSATEEIGQLEVIMAAVVFLFNVFVTIGTIKLYGHFKRRYERYREFRSSISLGDGEPKLQTLISRADARWVDRGIYGSLNKVRLHWIWTAVPMILTLGSASLILQLVLMR